MSGFLLDLQAGGKQVQNPILIKFGQNRRQSWPTFRPHEAEIQGSVCMMRRQIERFGSAGD